MEVRRGRPGSRKRLNCRGKARNGYKSRREHLPSNTNRNPKVAAIQKKKEGFAASPGEAPKKREPDKEINEVYNGV